MTDGYAFGPLSWFEKHPTMDAYRAHGHFAPYAVLSRDVRFSDAELAAEMYRAAAWIGANGRAHATGQERNFLFEAAFIYGPITRDEHEWLTVNRFATHPHFDETTKEYQAHGVDKGSSVL